METRGRSAAEAQVRVSAAILRSAPAELFALAPEFRRELDCELARLSGEFLGRSAKPARRLYRYLGEYVARSGKRVRPYFCLLGYRFGAEGAAAPGGLSRFCAAIELLHAFLLIHDDVADRSDTRRGLPALHMLLRREAKAGADGEYAARIGSDLAIVAGDVLYTCALEAMLTLPGVDGAAARRALSAMLGACRAAGEGQWLDLLSGASDIESVDARDVLDVYRLKTSSYTFEGPLVAGALLGNTSSDVVEPLREYATNVGIAFQVLDDLTSLLEDEAVTGKPALADLREGKKTWPVLAAYARMKADERAWLRSVLEGHEASESDLERLRALLRSTGALDAARGVVEEHARTADRALGVLRTSSPGRELAGFGHWLIARSRELAAKGRGVAKARERVA